MMKKPLLIGAAFAVLIGPALAADQAVRVNRRPVVVAAPIYSWTGFYVGGNVGGSWGNARTDMAGSATTAVIGASPFPVAFADSQTQRLNGVIGGGQVGYNYQFSPRWVLGFEADIQGSGERGSNTFADPFSGRLCLNFICSPARINGAVVTAYDAKIAWFGTIRGRLGFLIGDQVLLYGTGGLGYGRVALSGNTNVNGTVEFGAQAIASFAVPGTTAFSESKINTGFVAGGGIGYRQAGRGRQNIST
jgi:outer membrane immunogenic protein